MYSSKKPKIGILSGSRFLRESLSKITGNNASVVCSMPLSEFVELPDAANAPEVLVIDAHDTTHSLLNELIRKKPKAKVIIMNADSRGINIVECVRSGVAGFIQEDAAANEVVTTILNVGNGGRVIPSAVALKVCHQLSDEQNNGEYFVRNPALTVREDQILGLIIKGLTNKEIGNILNIAPHTVKNHVHHILQKLACRTRTEVIRTHLKAR